MATHLRTHNGGPSVTLIDMTRQRPRRMLLALVRVRGGRLKDEVAPLPWRLALNRLSAARLLGS
jgi:hypothetical protein